ncbi:MAG: alkaline phosphatase family protein [Anaerolineae bacterium]|nr:alkaline phosphatase family protein [Anaerolineae bacterium]
MAFRQKPGRRLWIGLLLAIFLIAGCTPAWEATLMRPDGSLQTVTRDTLLPLFDEEMDATPVERLLYVAGYELVASIYLEDTQGQTVEAEWDAVADSMMWELDGKITLGDTAYHVATVHPHAGTPLEPVAMHITDVAPTAAAALGLPSPAGATGQARDVGPAQHVLLLFLDAFGYIRYTEALADGLIPNLSALGEPLPGMTTYVPATAIASASVLTGATPDVHGVRWRGLRKTDAETLFDVASEAGLQVKAVEGEALAFEMRNADYTLSGDRDGNGSTDDNVLANALAVLDAGMPDLFWVHFHGIDDAGHTYGPGAPEEQAAIREVDAAVGTILAQLPTDTLVVIFADHGMHAVQEGERLGNHGHLIPRDMLIPIWVIER